MREDVGRLIKSEREKRKMTQEQLAEIAGLSRVSLARYETGVYYPSTDKLVAIADALGLSIDYILNQNDYQRTDRDATSTRIQVLGRVQAGIPIEAIEEILDWEEIPAAMAASGEYFALKVKGDSMEPKISQGDVVIVRQQPEVQSGQLAIVLVNGDEATVKRVLIAPEGITLIAFNPAYQPVFYAKKQIKDLPVQILGKVVELRAKFE